MELSHEKLGYLEGLRGLAALVVVFNHYVFAFYPALNSGDPKEMHTRLAFEMYIFNTPFLNLFYAGNFSVCIFFILSGFVLSKSYFEKREKDILAYNAVRRYFRLVMPVFLTVIVSLILKKFSLFYNVQASEITKSLSWLKQLWNIQPSLYSAVQQGLYGTFINNENSYNPVLWTMTYEFMGSLFVFSFISLFGNLKRRGYIYVITAFLLLNNYYLGFLVGMFLSDVIYAKNKEIKLSKLTKTIFLLVGLFLGSYPVSGTNNSIYSIFNIWVIKQPIIFYHTVGASLVILCLLASITLKTILSSKPFLFLGQISFSMYLLHILILGSFSCFIFISLTKYFHYKVSFSLMFISSLLVIILLSYLMAKYIDLNGIKVSKIIAKKVTSNSASNS